MFGCAGAVNGLDSYFALKRSIDTLSFVANFVSASASGVGVPRRSRVTARARAGRGRMDGFPTEA